MDTLLSKHWHHLPQDEVTTLLESNDISGLDTFEITHRQAHFGPNRLTQKKGKNPLILFLLQFHQPLVYILLAAAAVTFGVILINVIISYIQESKALKAIEALTRTMEGAATVVRAGEKQSRLSS